MLFWKASGDQILDEIDHDEGYTESERSTKGNDVEENKDGGEVGDVEKAEDDVTEEVGGNGEEGEEGKNVDEAIGGEEGLEGEDVHESWGVWHLVL